MRFVSYVHAAVLGAALMVPVLPGVMLIPSAHAQQAAMIEGVWQGTLAIPNGPQLRLVLKIEKSGDALKGTFWSIDQKSPPIPVDKITYGGDGLSLAIDHASIHYDGKLAADSNSIAGTFQQGDSKFPLVFARATPDTAWAIPEAPKPTPPMDPKADPSFDTATIKPIEPDDKRVMFVVNPGGQFHSEGMSLRELITIVYDLNPAQVAGLPDWAHEDKYTIDAKPDTPGVPSLKQLHSEVQKMLAERFALKYHMEKREMTAFRITLASGGPKMKPAAAGSGGLPGFFFTGVGRLNVANGTIAEFSHFLQSTLLDHPVVDQTGLGDKRFDFQLRWQIDDDQAIKMGMQKAPPVPEGADVPPPLFVALPEQTGLKLETAKIPVDVLVVDSVSRPSPN